MESIDNESTLEHNSNWFGKLTWTLIHRIIMILFFLTFSFGLIFWQCVSTILNFSYFLIIFDQLLYYEIHTDHVSSIVNNCLQVSLFSPDFSWFFLIFLLYLHWLPYQKMCTDHVTSIPISSPPSLFFSDFITIFYVKIEKFPCLAFISSTLVTGCQCHFGDQSPGTIPV